MEGKSEELKGHFKEAVGDLTDDEELAQEGKADQATGKAEEFIDKAADKAKDLADSLRDKFNKKG